MDWDPPSRPAEMAESRLIAAILDGRFPVESTLPPERLLAAQLGVTRPTLREALQRLSRDGWVDIRHGRPTRVRAYWRDGNLAVLGAVARHTGHPPPDFVPNLLAVRLLLAPAYARLAVDRAPDQIADLLRSVQQLPDLPGVFAAVDWEIHRSLTLASGNPVFTLILNGFADLYAAVGPDYFAGAPARDRSRRADRPSFRQLHRLRADVSRSVALANSVFAGLPWSQCSAMRAVRGNSGPGAASTPARSASTKGGATAP